MKIKRIITAVIIAAILISIGSCVHKCVSVLSHIRKFNDIFPSDSIEESRSKHAFMFEYELQPTFVYDSIPIRVKEAFVEHTMYYKDWDSDSIVINTNQEVVVILFENDPWPGYYGDTVTMSTADLYVNWMINTDIRIFANNRRFVLPSFKNDHYVPAPDTLLIPIREVAQIKDSADYDYGIRWRAVVKEDTIGMLQFIRKIE